jgi:hypothetical protein
MATNRNWVWFFVALVVLGLAAISINWAYNSRQQLTMARLIQAEDLWDKASPADYDLEIDKNLQSAGGDHIRERIDVRVRNRTVVSATLNGQPLPRRLWSENDVFGWFGFVEGFLKRAKEPNAPRAFCTAEFDPQTGQLLHFTRSVSSTRERQELTLKLTPVKP